MTPTVDLVEFITRMDSLIARVEFLPPSTLRDSILRHLLEARAAGDLYFGGTRVEGGQMMGRMS